MRYSLMAGVVFSMAACSTSTMSTGTGDDGGGDDGGGGGGGSKVKGWTAMPLLDDSSNPDQVVHHKGNDRVSGIYFESVDKGYVVTQEASADEDRGGAVFLADGAGIRSIAFNGNGTGLRLVGSIEFTGIQPTPTGYVAMAYAADVIASTDGGRTFAIAKNGPADASGIERALGYQVTATGTTMVLDSGKVSVLDRAPGPDAVLTDVWAPDATQPIPEELAPGECDGGPFGSGQPSTRYSVYISSDRQTIAYGSNYDQDVPKICISYDGGTSFLSHELAVADGVASRIPSGVTFTTAQNGIAWFADPVAGAYIQRTTDGGDTWNPVNLPSALADASLLLPVGFFAPDGQHGWLAGYDTSGFGKAVAIATSDGGATWTTVDGIADAVDAFHGGKLYAGFALDATHVWLGGEGGLVMHN